MYVRSYVVWQLPTKSCSRACLSITAMNALHMYIASEPPVYLHAHLDNNNNARNMMLRMRASKEKRGQIRATTQTTVRTASV